MKAPHVYAVILAGGQSSRLFPFNKVLSDLTGSGRSLIQQAYDRLDAIPKENIFVLTVKEMVTPVRRQLKLSSKHVLVDPVRRGTWPAILWAMAHLRQGYGGRSHDPDAVMAIVTGDHVIQGDRAFRQSFSQAVKIARSKPAIVMMGILPRKDPQEWRGFGCFRADTEGRVIEFQEKPPLERARQMIREGRWCWNSGMFFFRIKTAEEALGRLQPEMHRVYQAILSAIAAGKKGDAAFLYEDFADKIPHPLDPGHYVDNSIDYAIMTPLISRSDNNLAANAVTDVGFRWTDLGQWDALRQVLKADRAGNIRVGRIVIKDNTKDSILVAESGHSIEVNGAQDLIVAFSKNTALVLTSANLSRVKEAAQEAFKHPDRLVMEHDVTDCELHVTGGRLIAIGLAGLSIHLAKRRLVVRAKRGFIR